MTTVNIKINGLELEVPSNYTVLEAAREAGIDVPSLCFLKGINETGACRMCVVEVEGGRSLQASCVLPVREGMSIKTNSKRVRNAQKTTLELLLANHDRECLTCTRSGSCELQALSEKLNVSGIEYQGEKRKKIFNENSQSIVRDTSKCILCGRCVSVCEKSAGVGVLDFSDRGFKTYISPAFGFDMDDAGCLHCGQCIVNCPVAALREKNHIDYVWEALEDDTKHVVFQTAPAVRAAIGEEFGLPIGTRSTGKMVAAIRRLGANDVFDTNFAADLTIMEEAHELLDRIENDGVLPMITSCSPGWVRLCEFNFPELLPNLSTCKSPMQMFSAVMKTYYAEKLGKKPEDIVVVAVMPCTSKKTEAARPEMGRDGYRDTDYSITTRELAQMIRQSGIDFNKLPDEDFDPVFGEYTGAGVIFGATGGVMEAAIRTAADVLEGKDLPEVEYTAVRGVQDIKEAEVTLGGKTLKVAIAHGGKAASDLMEKVKSGEADYHFIEIMACTGGCVNGGGQPHVSSQVKNAGIDVRAERAKALYEEDELCVIRKSHHNPAIQNLYKEFLGKPNSHKSHELLHTFYTSKELFPIDKK